MAASHGDHGDADEEHGFEDKERTREHQQKAATGWPDPRRWEPKALYILTLKNPIRKFAILLCEHGRLDFVVLVAIVASTAAMALSDPFDTPSRRPESPIRGLSTRAPLSSAVFLSRRCVDDLPFGTALVGSVLKEDVCRWASRSSHTASL